MNLNRLLFLRFIAISLLFVSLVACGSIPQEAIVPVQPSITLPQPSLPTSSLVTVTPLSLPTAPIITETVEPVQQVDSIPSNIPKYLLMVDFDYPEHILDVVETVEYTNLTSETLDYIFFVIEPNRLRKTFELKDLRWGDNQRIPIYDLRYAKLEVPLRRPLAPGKSEVIKISYRLMMPYLDATFGYTNRQMNVANWYPFIPPYKSGVGWIIRDPSSVGEHLTYDEADYNVEIHPSNDSKNIIIAAPAPAKYENEIYYYEHKTARNFVWSASHDYEIVWAKVGEVNVMGYVFPNDVEAGKYAARFTREALELYSKLYTPYRRPLLTFVEANFSDGMEYDGLYFLGLFYFANKPDKGAQSGLAMLSVHETAHQWWGGVVGNDQAYEPWLDEAFSTFSELLFYEQLYPHLTDWWCGNRVRGFAPSGYVNGDIYHESDLRHYINAVYLRGTIFLDELRQRIGKETFMTFLQEYVKRNEYRITNTQDFFNLLTEIAPSGWSDLSAKYFSPKN